MIQVQRTDCTAADGLNERTLFKIKEKKCTNETVEGKIHLSLVKLNVKLLFAFLPFY